MIINVEHNHEDWDLEAEIISTELKTYFGHLYVVVRARLVDKGTEVTWSERVKTLPYKAKFGQHRSQIAP